MRLFRRISPLEHPHFSAVDPQAKRPDSNEVWTEIHERRELKVLSFKINPKDEAEPGKGPEIISGKSTHFDTYATCLKVPNAKSIQPNVGAVVGYFTYHQDPEKGLSEIDFEWLLADSGVIYVGTWTGKSGKLERIGRTIHLVRESSTRPSTERITQLKEKNQPDFKTFLLK